MLHPRPARPDGMAIWPFGRKRRKDEKAAEHEKTLDMAQPSGSEAQRTISNVPSKLTKRLSKSSRKGRDRNASQTSLRAQGAKGRDSEKDLPPIPSIPPQHFTRLGDIRLPAEGAASSSARLPLAERYNDAIPRPFADAGPSASQMSLQPEHFTVQGIDAMPPTLRPKRSTTADAEMPRKKSSRRKSGNREREQEIKATSGPSPPIPIPRRPQSYQAGMLSRDSKKFHGGLNRHFERPTSEISLPIPESVRSSISGPSEWQQSFKVSAFDALAPRPTIKYLESPRNTGSRTSMRKDKGPAIPEESFNTRARLDDLADDLDARGLRELMERDQRRRERKHKRDTEKLKRKLEQRNMDMERVRQVPAATREAAPRTEQPETCPSSTAEEARPTSGEASREKAQSPASWLQDPSREALPASPNDPFLDTSDKGSERESPVIETAKAVRLSSASMSPPLSPETRHARGPSNLSNFMTPPEATSDDREEKKAASSKDEPQTNTDLSTEVEEDPVPLRPQEEQKNPEATRHGGSGWTSFFRRSKSRKEPSERRTTTTPTSFSNTSRESFARSAKAQSPLPPIVQRSFKRPSSGAPVRTQSRFREDLPELPASSSNPSRMQSPEPSATSPSPYIDHASKVEGLSDDGRVTTPLGDVHPVFREEVASRSRGQSFRSATPSEHQQQQQQPSTMMLSQSLASIDSEGSWLSGRPAKRSSIPISSLRESQASPGGTLRDGDEATSPEPESTFPRQSPPRSTPSGPGGLTAQLRHAADIQAGSEAQASSAATAAPSSSTAERQLRYETVPAFHANPRVVSPPASGGSAHAHQPLRGEIVSTVSALSGTEPASPSPEMDPVLPVSPVSPAAGAEGSGGATLQRATSVDYGRSSGHARQVSAGSARLLDIRAKASNGDGKRTSLGPEAERARGREAAGEEASASGTAGERSAAEASTERP